MPLPPPASPARVSLTDSLSGGPVPGSGLGFAYRDLDVVSLAAHPFSGTLPSLSFGSGRSAQANPQRLVVLGVGSC
jgi:hypothetical protein